MKISSRCRIQCPRYEDGGGDSSISNSANSFKWTCTTFSQSEKNFTCIIVFTKDPVVTCSYSGVWYFVYGSEDGGERLDCSTWVGATRCSRVLKDFWSPEATVGESWLPSSAEQCHISGQFDEDSWFGLVSHIAPRGGRRVHVVKEASRRISTEVALSTRVECLAAGGIASKV